MSVNKYRPHVFVLPEDDANRQLANGFLLGLDLAEQNIRVLQEAGGWTAALECFLKDHVAEMERYPHRHMILLIDFDGHELRLDLAREKIPEHLAHRVFVLGALNEPEQLRSALALSYESIGQRVAQGCRDQTDAVWRHPLLLHNAFELERLRAIVRPILFPSV